MKKVFLLLSFIFCVPFFAQNINTEIETEFKDYNSLISTHQFEKALEVYGNEDFLKLFPRADLVAMMDKSFNNPDVLLKLLSPTNIIISDATVEDKGKKFVKIDFQQSLEMKFIAQDMSADQLLTILKSSFGNDHVKYDDKTEYFLIETFKTAVASSIDLKSWKFMVLEKKQIPILLGFIPMQFLKDLK
jgi:hypothetical protein